MNYAHYGFDNVAPAVSPNMPAQVAPAFDGGYGYPAVAPYGYGCQPVAGHGYGGTGTFVLVVVLFILLIIIGCSCGNW